MIAICDIDGTIAKNEYRVNTCTINGKINWDCFFDPEKIINDEVNETVNFFLKCLNKEMPIVFVTGRPEKLREVTQKWLRKNLPYITTQMIYMRQDEDRRPDVIIKNEIYEKYLIDEEIFVVLEDRNSVVELWRSLGLKCFQTKNGNF